jgi:hypothetical protein
MSESPALFRLRWEHEPIEAWLHEDDTWRATDVIVERLLNQGYTMTRVCEYVPLMQRPDPWRALADRAALHFHAAVVDLRPPAVAVHEASHEASRDA